MSYWGYVIEQLIEGDEKSRVARDRRRKQRHARKAMESERVAHRRERAPRRTAPDQ